MRIASILNEKEITLSCEVFPPKHFDGIAQASAVAQERRSRLLKASLICFTLILFKIMTKGA